MQEQLEAANAKILRLQQQGPVKQPKTRRTTTSASKKSLISISNHQLSPKISAPSVIPEVEVQPQKVEDSKCMNCVALEEINKSLVVKEQEVLATVCIVMILLLSSFYSFVFCLLL